MLVRIPGSVLREAVGIVEGLLRGFIACLSRTVRCVGSVGPACRLMEWRLIFALYPQDNPGKPGKRSRITGSRGPRVALHVMRAAFTHPARGLRSRARVVANEGCGSERGNFVALRAE